MDWKLKVYKFQQIQLSNAESFEMVSTTSAADALIFSNATVDSCAVKFEDYIFPIQTGN